MISDHIRKLEVAFVYTTNILHTGYHTEYEYDTLTVHLNSKVFNTLPLVRYLRQLTSVDISVDLHRDRKNIKISISTFKECPKIKKIQLEGVTITDTDIVLPTTIDTLNIRYCYMSRQYTVHDLIDVLPVSLKYLYLVGVDGLSSDIKARSIDSINRLTNLIGMCLYELSSITLPDRMDGLRSIDVIRIDRCPDIDSIPDSIRSLTTLSGIHVTNCNLSTLPDGLYTLTNLQYLNFFKNKLTGDVLDRMCDIPNLLNIDVSHNRIEYRIPSVDRITRLSRLEVLNIRCNDFYGELTNEWLSSLVHLRDLSISDNDRLSGCIDAIYRPRIFHIGIPRGVTFTSN